MLSNKIDEVVKHDNAVISRSDLINKALVEYLSDHYDYDGELILYKPRKKSKTIADLFDDFILLYPIDSLTLSELSKNLDMNKSNLHDSLAQLVEKDLLIKNKIPKLKSVTAVRKCKKYRAIAGKEFSFTKSNNPSIINQMDIYQSLDKKRFLTIKGICERMNIDYEPKKLRFHRKLLEMQKKGVIEVKPSLTTNVATTMRHEAEYSINWEHKTLKKLKNRVMMLSTGNLSLLTEIRDEPTGWIHAGKLNTIIENKLHELQRYGFINWTSWYENKELRHRVDYIMHTSFVSSITKKSIEEKLIKLK